MLTKSLLGAGALALSATLADAAGTQSRRIEFDANGVRLVGTLHLPADHKPGEKLPGLLVTGSWTTVKEQMPDGYAREMAKRGYAALTFDFTGYGADSPRRGARSCRLARFPLPRRRRGGRGQPAIYWPSQRGPRQDRIDAAVDVHP
jgi:dienelactone hydrolase